jgi:hypothetical protein
MRTTIYLDERVNARLQRFVPRRGLNRFINQVLAEKLAVLEREQLEQAVREQLEQAMKEGYLATRGERADVSEDWAVVDTEGWPA